MPDGVCEKKVWVIRPECVGSELYLCKLELALEPQLLVTSRKFTRKLNDLPAFLLQMASVHVIYRISSRE